MFAFEKSQAKWPSVVYSVVWEKITSSEEYKKIESMELEELEAQYLDLSFSPEGWLDKKPSLPKKNLLLSLSSKKHRFAAPLTSDKFCDAAKSVYGSQ